MLLCKLYCTSSFQESRFIIICLTMSVVLFPLPNFLKAKNISSLNFWYACLLPPLFLREQGMTADSSGHFFNFPNTQFFAVHVTCWTNCYEVERHHVYQLVNIVSISANIITREILMWRKSVGMTDIFSLSHFHFMYYFLLMFFSLKSHCFQLTLAVDVFHSPRVFLCFPE